MLEQEGLSQISCSAASEQVAYFLVERAALLGKLQVAAQQLESHSIIDGLQVSPTPWLWPLESCGKEYLWDISVMKIVSSASEATVESWG